MKFPLIIAAVVCTSLLKLGAGTSDGFPLDFSKAANREFVDEVAGDGKGGWSDQGPKHDLREFDVARRETARRWGSNRSPGRLSRSNPER